LFSLNEPKGRGAICCVGVHPKRREELRLSLGGECSLAKKTCEEMCS